MRTEDISRPPWWLVVVQVVIIFALMAAAIVFGASVKADPGVTPQVAVYAAKSAPAVCSTLDDYPTLQGVAGVAEGITEDGFTYYQAGEILVLAVEAKCPRWIPLLQRFINTYDQPTGSVSVA